jgi:hypothetical protein
MTANVGNRFEASARRAALFKGYTRPEAIIIVVLAVVMAAVCLADVLLPPWTWPIWIVLGALGATVIAFTSTRDVQQVNKIKEEIVSEEIDSNDLQISELQAGVARALYQHKSIHKMIAARSEDFASVSSNLDEWLNRVYRLASGLDTILRHPRVLEHFHTVMETNEVKNANFDSLAGLDNAAAVVTAGHAGEQAFDEDYNKLILARDAVAQSRNSLNATIDHVVSVNEVLRHTRQHTLGEQHISQMQVMLQGEIDTLAEAQRIVYKLGAAYDIDLN